MKPFTEAITFIYTRDYNKTIHFYETILGLPLKLNQGACRIYGVANGAYIGFCKREDAAKPGGVILTFVTDDVDGWYDHLVGHGIVFEKTPAYNPEYKIYHCFFRDPNGYLLEIQRFEDPRW